MHKPLILAPTIHHILKEKRWPKSLFSVATTRCNKYYYTTWHEVKEILYTFLGKNIQFSLYAYPKFISRSYITGITSETPIVHMFYRWHILRKPRPRKKLYVFCWQNCKSFLATRERPFSFWKIATGIRAKLLFMK